MGCVEKTIYFFPTVQNFLSNISIEGYTTLCNPAYVNITSNIEETYRHYLNLALRIPFFFNLGDKAVFLCFFGFFRSLTSILLCTSIDFQLFLFLVLSFQLLLFSFFLTLLSSFFLVVIKLVFVLGISPLAFSVHVCNILVVLF